MRSIFLFSLFILGCQQKPLLHETVESHIDHPVEIQLHLVSRLPAFIPCPDDMVHVEDYCIDRYEAPNIKGAYPFSAQTAFQAINYCQAIGKQLCTQERWHTACIGPAHKLYPYGNLFKPGICNDNKHGWVYVPWLMMGTSVWDRFCQQQYKGDPSGSHPKCVSDYGVYDLTGNVAEWVREPNSSWGFMTKGGYWYGTLQDTPSCNFINPAHSPGFNSYEFGFRCCKAAN